MCRELQVDCVFVDNEKININRDLFGICKCITSDHKQNKQDEY